MADNEAKIVLSAQDKTKQAFDSVKKGLSDLRDKAESLPGQFGSIGLAVAGAFEAASLKHVIDIGDELNKLSQKTGLAVESLSALKYAGSLADVGIDDLATGIKKLGNNMAGAAGGGKQQQAIFDAIGVSVRNVRGELRSTDDVLGDIADKFASYEDGAGKAAIATELFGKNGASLIPLLNRGRAGLEESRKEAEQLGIVMGPDFAQASEQFNDNLTKINASLQASKIVLANELLPQLNKFLEALIGIRKAREEGGFFGSIAKEFKANTLSEELTRVTDDIIKFQQYIDDPNSKGPKTGARNRLQQLRQEYADIQKQVQKTSEELKGFANVAKPVGDTGAFESGFTPTGPKKKQAPTINKEAEAAAAAYDALIKKIRERGAAEAAEYEIGRKLTDAEKFGIDVMTELALANSKLTDEQKRNIAADLERTLQLAKGNEERKRQAEADKETAEAAQQHIRDIFKSIDARKQENEALADQIAEIGLTAGQIESLRIARLEAAKAAEEQALAEASAKDALSQETLALQKSIDLLDQQIRLRRAARSATEKEANDPTRGVQRGLDDYVETAKKAGEATEALTKKATQDLEDGLTAVLTGGKFDIKNWVDGILAQLVRLQVVRPFLDSIFKGIGKSSDGDLLGLLGGLVGRGSGLSIDTSGYSFAGTILPNVLRGGAATGTNLVQRDMVTLLHKGEAVVPKAYNPAAGGAGAAPTIIQNNYIDSSTDQANLAQIAGAAADQAIRRYHAQRIANGASV